VNKDIKRPSLLSRWKNKDKKETHSAEITKAPLSDSYALTHAQERLWFLQNLYPDNVFYNLSEYYAFTGILNIDALKTSLNLIFDKHQILRSYYPTENNKAVLKINNSKPLIITEKDFSHLNETEAQSESEIFINNQAKFNFNLSSDVLFKMAIVKISNDKHILFLTFHHIIVDQWSIRNLTEDIASHYKRISQGLQTEPSKDSIDFIDYAYWQNNKQSDARIKQYWKNKLSGEIPVLNLPLDFNRPNKPSYKGKHIDFKFSKEHSKQILDLAKQLEVTPFVLFLSAYYIVLQKFCKQDDILIGSPISHRDLKGLESVFGLFIDTTVFRVSVNKSLTASQFIKAVNTMSMEALANKDIPFDVIVKALNIERSLSINPLFQAMFVYTSNPESPAFGEHLELTDSFEYSPNVSKFDLTLFITENQGDLSATFEYATDLFEDRTIIRFQEHLKHTLKHIVSDTEKILSSIPILIEAEEQQLTLNNTIQKSNFDSYQNIHAIIENISLETPNNIALTFGDQSISYKTLNNKANVVAQHILKTKNKNNIVGLCMERSLDMIIGMLGILKSGHAYLPIDPKYPKQRINFMLNDAEVDTIVSQNALLNLFEEFDITSVLIDNIDDILQDPNLELPEVKETDLAYIIYTSGSTGQPKGVPITHQNIINSTAGRFNFYNEKPSAFFLMSSISFDSSKAGIFWTLCAGGNLIISEERIEQDLVKIANIIKTFKVSHTLMLPSLYKVILEHVETKKLEHLNTVIVAGEACSKSLCQIHFKTLPNVSLYNEYGPTEASVWCMAHKIDALDMERHQIPIGKPVANAQVYLLDDQKNKVPFGTSGEIYIGGDGLSKGYLNRPELTNEVFIKNPFNTGNKLYKTGDLGKYRDDGAIEFLGRIDQQIKIRGYRVELDAIENTINNSALVKISVVVVKQDEGKPKRLIAYIIQNGSFDESKLKRELKAVLPDYMVPSSFVLIDDMPLLPNGKVDQKALSNIEIVLKPKETKDTEKPKNDIEQTLLDIWEDILNIKPLSITDNFFEIGGDSILSIQIIAKARKAGLSIAPNQLFEHQTISELAMFVEHENKTTKILETLVSGSVPLTPIQEWFFETHKTAPEYWNQNFKIKDLPEHIDKSIIQKLTNHLITAHHALRLSFGFKDDKWNAKVLNPDEIDAFISIDISDEEASNYNSKIEDTLIPIQENMTLEKGHLFKCIYFETGNYATNTIVLLAHHLVIDFVSWQIILNTYTTAIHNNILPEQVAATSSIKTWGNHLLELSQSKTITSEVEFWKQQTVPQATLPKDFDGDFPLLEKDISAVYFEVDQIVTHNLVTESNAAYNTKIEELLLTALIDVLSDWTGNNNMSLAMERHGREVIDSSIDLSNTVGWFTAFFPKSFNFESTTDIASKIIATKEQMRQIPNGGVGYGILRYLTSQLGNVPYPNIVFNFLGKQTTGKNNIEFSSHNARHALTERYYYLEINALIKDDVLSLNWSYSNKIHKPETIQTLIHSFNESLQHIVTHCTYSDTVKYTPSDFEDVDLDQTDLDNLLNDLDF